MKILITGSRNFTDYKGLEESLNDLEVILAITDGDEHRLTSEILHGGAKGADELANLYAKLNGLKCTVIKPNYQKHHSKTAPLLRNTKLVAAAEATLALYGPGRDGKGGTADTAKKTKAARKHLLERYSDGTWKHTPPAPKQTKLW